MARKKIVFLTGAGMSVESGFKTFRGSDGLWEDFPVEQVASHQGWLDDPVLVNNFYNDLRKKLLKAEPNAGHLRIAELEKQYDVVVVTQNVDNLHERAGSTKVVHLHGELLKICSSRDQFDPRYVVELGEENSQVMPGQLAGDGSLARPFIVFFGESVPEIATAAEHVEQADIFVIVGTSLNVYPAAGLVRYTRRGIPIYLIDPDDVALDPRYGIKHLKMGASEGMKQLETLL